MVSLLDRRTRNEHTTTEEQNIRRATLTQPTMKEFSANSNAGKPNGK